ncbi:MAG: two-component system, OmpR family, phosphate regulon response regulator PhoB [Parcubacteria group bacterium Gr01-1014_31]|nr:MAG: two-component system, OmpR family, phosphate regulon response regulator PhoB [Parcubacteria group bacterium Gr01-1014_31]
MASPKESVKIVLVEDDTTLVEMYSVKFNQEGFDLKVATNGGQGLELAKKELPRIVLLDVILPGMDGFAVLKELKADAKTKHIPVLLLTNLGQDADMQKGKALGAADYLVKANLTPGEVVEKVRAILGGK